MASFVLSAAVHAARAHRSCRETFIAASSADEHHHPPTPVRQLCRSGVVTSRDTIVLSNSEMRSRLVLSGLASNMPANMPGREESAPSHQPSGLPSTRALTCYTERQSCSTCLTSLSTLSTPSPNPFGGRSDFATQAAGFIEAKECSSHLRFTTLPLRPPDMAPFHLDVLRTPYSSIPAVRYHIKPRLRAPDPTLWVTVV